jgi:hypothetical protein
VGFNVQLLPSHRQESPGLAHHIGIAANRVVLSKNIGSCVHAKLLQHPWKRGFPHVTSCPYRISQKVVIFQCVVQYYRRLKANENGIPNNSPPLSLVIPCKCCHPRCLKHAMVVLAKEKMSMRPLYHPLDENSRRRCRHRRHFYLIIARLVPRRSPIWSIRHDL